MDQAEHHQDTTDLLRQETRQNLKKGKRLKEKRNRGKRIRTRYKEDPTNADKKVQRWLDFWRRSI